MNNLNSIKLIIWDLDDTLWHGTLSEGTVSINETFKSFIADTADMGIIHSIVSKNDYSPVKEELQKLGIWDYFVFPSINWEAKGERINSLIKLIKLRNENVLFIDDNIQNLEEAKYYNPELMTALPDELNGLIKEAEAAEKTDIEHKRLKQYKLLEEKEKLKADFSDNSEFLMMSGIRAELHNDCFEHIDRIYEMIQRTNQLNYTKFRQDRDGLISLLNDGNSKCGYVTVSDRFGDYGIVGFYAVQNGKAIHFLFSCRTLGMSVEQWVYEKIGFPEIDIQGEVAAEISKSAPLPKWINRTGSPSLQSEKAKISQRVLFKGPCDLEQIFSFIKADNGIVTEFTYVNGRGVEIEGTSHTSQFLTALTATQEEKEKLCSEFPWFDDKMLDTALQNENFDTVYYSLLADANLGLYRKKGSDLYIALCQKCDDLTDSENHAALINGKTFTSNIRFTQSELERFAKAFEFTENEDFSLTISNLDKIYALTKDRIGKWVILLGSEKEYKANRNPNYVNRHLMHKILNDKVKKWAEDKENVILIELGKYISGDEDYVDSINHFTKKVYYTLAQDIASSAGASSLETKGKGALLYRTVRQKGRQILKKFKG